MARTTTKSISGAEVGSPMVEKTVRTVIVDGVGYNYSLAVEIGKEKFVASYKKELGEDKAGEVYEHVIANGGKKQFPASKPANAIIKDGKNITDEVIEEKKPIAEEAKKEGIIPPKEEDEK